MYELFGSIIVESKISLAKENHKFPYILLFEFNN